MDFGAVFVLFSFLSFFLQAPSIGGAGGSVWVRAGLRARGGGNRAGLRACCVRPVGGACALLNAGLLPVPQAEPAQPGTGEGGGSADARKANRGEPHGRFCESSRSLPGAALDLTHSVGVELFQEQSPSLRLAPAPESRGAAWLRPPPQVHVSPAQPYSWESWRPSRGLRPGLWRARQSASKAAQCRPT